MFDLFPQLIIFLALAAIVVILARRLPKLQEIEVNKETQKKPTNILLAKFLAFWKRSFLAFKFFSVDIFRKLYRKTKEIREKRKIIPQSEKEIKELVSTPPPIEKIKVVAQDEIVGLLERAAKFFGSGNFGEAERTYIEIIKKDPKNFYAYKGLGKLYLKQGNLKDAKASFEEALKLKPGDLEAINGLEEIKSKMPSC
jgi:tetratricopeptide (TPR) repeat protein